MNYSLRKKQKQQQQQKINKQTNKQIKYISL